MEQRKRVKSGKEATSLDLDVSDISTRRKQENSQICGHGAQRRDLGWRFKSMGHLHMVVIHKEEVWTRM